MERLTWEHFEGYRGLRWVIMAIVACFAWAGTTFDYNYQEPVVDLEVWREATFFDRNDIQTWGETKLFETSIDHPVYKNPNGKINVSFQAPAPTRPTGRVLLRDWFRPAPVLNPNPGDSAPGDAD
jgi:hypothetical protein